MHERHGDDAPLMLDDKRIPAPQIGPDEHPIDRRQALRVTLRLVEIRFQHDVKRVIQEPLGDNACHFGDICTSCGSTLHSSPPLLCRTVSRDEVENLTTGRQLSYYAMSHNLTLSVNDDVL